MSYSFRVMRTEGGEPAVFGFSGQVPEGTIVVSGHEDDGNASIGITRYAGDADSSRVIVQASGYASKA